MRLSQNLSLNEMTKSQTAIRHGIDNTPNEEQLENMIYWAENIFQPVRNWYGKPVHVTSGLRVPALNKAIGGSTSSQHCKGEAGDLDTHDNSENMKIFQWIIEHLMFDQIIWEFGDDKGPAWVHVSVKREGKNRGQILKAYKENGRTKYDLINGKG